MKATSPRRKGRGTVLAQRERQRRIHALVSEFGSCPVEQIAERVEVSVMTAYRDVAQLESRGLLHRSRGLVTAAASSLYEASSLFRRGQNTRAKEELARAALALVEPGSSVLMDDSSTGLALAPLLSERTPLTLITNYVPIAKLAAEEQDLTLLVTGGEYTAWADAFMGSMTVNLLGTVHAHSVFMSASAVTEGACYHPIAEVAEVKRAMLQAASFSILYVDSSKFERTALHQVAPVGEFDVVIVDSGTPRRIVDELKGSGVRVIKADPLRG